MTKFTAIFSALTQAKQWLEFIKSGNRIRDEKYDLALEALYTALNETKIYIGSIERKRAHTDQNSLESAPIGSEETEAQLSRLWTKAALKIRHYDPALANRLSKKADYWANPDKWSAADVARAHITIDEVFAEARDLLMNSPG